MKLSHSNRPPNLAVEVDLPHQGRVRGMGIVPGVTVIVGGGFHGKSTLLKALEAGVYNKVRGGIMITGFRVSRVWTLFQK